MTEGRPNGPLHRWYIGRVRVIPALLSALAVVLIALPAAAAADTTPTCAEGPTTVAGITYGTTCADVIIAPAGVETVKGGGGNDTIVAGPLVAEEACPDGCHLGVGSQTFEGGPGDHAVYAEPGNDTPSAALATPSSSAGSATICCGAVRAMTAWRPASAPTRLTAKKATTTSAAIPPSTASSTAAAAPTPSATRPASRLASAGPDRACPVTSPNPAGSAGCGSNWGQAAKTPTTASLRTAAASTKSKSAPSR